MQYDREVLNDKIEEMMRVKRVEQGTQRAKSGLLEVSDKTTRLSKTPGHTIASLKSTPM